jgi:gamma-glutamylcysteine synthetase
MYYLPYATSLRLSDLGYTNKSQSNLGITFNELHEYVAGLKRAIKTPSEEYAKSASKKTVSACKSTAMFCRLKTNCMRRFVRSA